MSAPRPTFLDEVQCAGDPLILAIKTATDRDRRPRQFFLSGSTRFLTVPTLSESLAGRVAILDLWPLSVAERSGVRPEIIAQLFTEPQVVLGTGPPRSRDMSICSWPARVAFRKLCSARRVAPAAGGSRTICAR